MTTASAYSPGNSAISEMQKDSASIIDSKTYEKLKLDPNAPPTLEYPQDTFSIIAESYKAKGESYDLNRDGGTANPWTLEQFPMLADWIKEMDKPLDAIAEMIRKPVFCRRLFNQKNGSNRRVPGICFPSFCRTSSHVETLHDNFKQERCIG